MQYMAFAMAPTSPTRTSAHLERALVGAPVERLGLELSMVVEGRDGPDVGARPLDHDVDPRLGRLDERQLGTSLRVHPFVDRPVIRPAARRRPDAGPVAPKVAVGVRRWRPGKAHRSRRDRRVDLAEDRDARGGARLQPEGGVVAEEAPSLRRQRVHVTRHGYTGGIADVARVRLHPQPARLIPIAGVRALLELTHREQETVSPPRDD